MDDERTGGEHTGTAPDDEEPAPLQDLADRIRATESGTGAADGPIGSADATDVFREEGANQLATEAVWKSIESDWPDATDHIISENIEGEHVVAKRWYCERCEHFSEPPEVYCMHEGTTILEFVGTEDVRVRNCPVVAERKALGQFSGTDTA